MLRCRARFQELEDSSKKSTRSQAFPDARSTSILDRGFPINFLAADTDCKLASSFMAGWFWYAVAAAVLYGAHQIFTRLAAERIGDGLGGFVVEASAALSILIYLAVLWFSGRWNQKFSGGGFNYSLLTGVCVGAGTIAFFLLFQKGGRFRRCPPFLRAAPPSWPSRGFCSFTKRRRGNAFSVSHSRLSDYFCSENNRTIVRPLGRVLIWEFISICLAQLEFDIAARVRYSPCTTATILTRDAGLEHLSQR